MSRGEALQREVAPDVGDHGDVSAIDFYHSAGKGLVVLAVEHLAGDRQHLCAYATRKREEQGKNKN